MDIPVPLLAGIATAAAGLIAIVIAISKLAQKIGKIESIERKCDERHTGYLATRYDVNARIAHTNGKVDALMIVRPGPTRAAAGARLPQPSPIDPPDPR